MTQDYRKGPLTIYALDTDGEIEVEIEDYETLYMLRELIESRADKLSPEKLASYRSLLEVPESITRDMTHFTTDPAPILARRAEVAGAIEELSK